jgi:hypothetical protein
MNIPESPVASLALASHATVEAPLSQLAALRDQPVPESAPALPGRFRRHGDEQTVVGVRAVREAIARYPGPRPSFERFGVVGSTCGAGRISAAQTRAKLPAGGGVVVSPHVVPQCSLHALASAVSVGLGMKGPNIGTSGGPHAVSEGLIAAISLMGRQDCEGVWLVVTEWAGELLLDTTGKPTNDPSCRGLAIAITHQADAGLGLTLHSGSHEPGSHETAGDWSGDPVGSLAALAAAVEMCRSGEVLESWSHRCPWGMEVRIASRRRGVVLDRDRSSPLREAA